MIIFKYKFIIYLLFIIYLFIIYKKCLLLKKLWQKHTGVVNGNLGYPQTYRSG